MTAVATPQAGADGRAAYHLRRAQTTSEKILTTALEILDRDGVDGFTIEQVSAASGVAKTTIYRRYDNAVELAAAALFPDVDGVESRVPDLATGDLARAARSWAGGESAEREQARAEALALLTLDRIRQDRAAHLERRAGAWPEQED